MRGEQGISDLGALVVGATAGGWKKRGCRGRAEE